MLDAHTERLMMGAAGGGSKTYVDDVFSTYLYYGNTTAKTITNGVDNTKGGMVWIKSRSASGNNTLFDTERGATYYIRANLTSAGNNDNNTLNAFNNNGFGMGNDTSINDNNTTYTSWNFRKAKGFFDIVTWTGNDTDRDIPHNLGSVPGCIMVKCTSATKGWRVYHRRIKNSGSEDYTLELNDTSGIGSANAQPWNSTAPTATHFTVSGASSQVNGVGNTYVAYLFASQDERFGEEGDRDIIKCDSYTGNGSKSGPSINCGWEPQWVMVKRVDGSGSWHIFDQMRGWSIEPTSDSDTARQTSIGLEANETNSESDKECIVLKNDGFRIYGDNANQATYNDNGHRYIYIAIRRPDARVGKPAEVGTDVFDMVTSNQSTTIPLYVSPFPVDFAIERDISQAWEWDSGTRLVPGRYFRPNNTDGFLAWARMAFDSNIGWFYHSSSYDSNFKSWMWKRHAGFDVQGYKGNGGTKTVQHGLYRTPEMIWVKCRDTDGVDWQVYHFGCNSGTNPSHYRLRLNTTDVEDDNQAFWNDQAPNASAFYLGTATEVNGNNNHFCAFLFASVDGISKCGYYDGSDSANTITTGFQPRFVIIKRSSGGSGSWYVLDTLRGWGAGDDKDIKLNMTNAQQDYDIGAPTSTGFTLTVDSAWNSSGNKYVYYAHA